MGGKNYFIYAYNGNNTEVQSSIKIVSNDLRIFMSILTILKC